MTKKLEQEEITRIQKYIIRNNTGLMAILPGEPGSASFPIDSPSLNILFNTIPPCPSQKEGGEGMAVKKEE